jgi:hypothetical protein
MIPLAKYTLLYALWHTYELQGTYQALFGNRKAWKVSTMMSGIPWRYTKTAFPPLSITAYRMRRQDPSGELAQSPPGVLHLRLVTKGYSKVDQNIIVAIPMR